MASLLRAIKTKMLNEKPKRDMESFTALEILPAELINKLFQYAPSSLFPMRLVSRTLRSRVDAYVRTISIVEKLYILNYPLSTSKMRIDVRVDEEKIDLFQLRLRLNNFLMMSSKTECLDKFNSDLYENPDVYRVYVNKEIIDENTLNIFRACIGNRIDRIVLESVNPGAHPVISKIFETFKFDALEVIARPLSQNDVDYLLPLIELHKIDKLTLRVGRIESPNPVEILLKLSSVVRSLDIDQQKVRGIATNCRYLFGVYNRDWAAIILEMLSRKLIALSIDNHGTTEFLTSKSVAKLREELPKLSKNVWLILSYNGFTNGFTYAKKDH